jgi:hypothetical protein
LSKASGFPGLQILYIRNVVEFLRLENVPSQDLHRIIQTHMTVPWLRRLVAGLSPQRPGFDPGSVRVGFVVDKVALEQVLSRVIRFSPANFIPPVLHYLEKLKKLTIFFFIFIIGLHNKLQGCGASVASDAGPFSKKEKYKHIKDAYIEDMK